MEFATTHRFFYRQIRDGMQIEEAREDDLLGCLRTAIGESGKQFLIQMGANDIKMWVMAQKGFLCI